MRLAALSLLFVCSLTAFAQSDRGTITGTVSDPAGAVVAAAKVEAKNTGSGQTYETATTDTGNFTLAQLPVGTYELSVQVAGFKKYIRQNVEVNVAQTIRIDAALEVGATTESITVSTEAPMLKTESGEISYNIAYDKVNQLPIVTLGGGATTLGNIRNPLAVITLLPGGQFSNDNTLRINGMPSSSQAIRVEGQDATNGVWRQQNQNTQTGIEAVQEVAIQTSNFAAEFGQAGGGFINYTMKSGTNSFHGGAFEQYVNEAFNAGTPFTNAGTTNSLKAGQHIRNPIRQHDYGFTFGGPLWLPKIYDGHDKTFFFFSFEQFRQNLTVRTGVSTVPNEAYRQGNFSAALGQTLQLAGAPAQDPLNRPLVQNQIYDPNTSRLINGAVVRDPFPAVNGVNNVVPATRIDPVAAKIQALLPLPLGPAATALVNNYSIPAYSNYRHTSNPTFKLDHSLSSNVKISGFFSYQLQTSPSANGFEQAFTTAQPQDTYSTTTRFNYDQTIRPTVLLHIGVGYLHTNLKVISRPFDQSAFWAKNQQFDFQAFPAINGINDAQRGGNSIGLGTGFGALFIKEEKPTATVSLTWVKGNHTYKFGGEMIVSGIPTLNTSRANGQFGFGASQSGIGSWEDGRGLNSTTGFPYASFLLGQASSITVVPIAPTRLGNHSFAFFAQDTWKVTRKLTLDYGLRYDYVTELREQYGRMQSAAFNLPNPVASNRLGTVIYEGDGGGRCNCRFQSNYPFAFGPRLGAAYQINSKTVFRAGAGLAYGSAPNDAFLSYSVNDFLTLTNSFGERVSRLQDGNIYAPGNPFGNTPETYPNFTPRFPAEVSPGFRPPTSVFISIDRNAGRPPRIFQWSIGLQREIARNLVVEAAYVGNRGAWWTAPLLSTYNYNALTIDGLKSMGVDINNATDRNLLLARINSPQVLGDRRFAYLVNPASVYNGFPTTQPLGQALRPYPQWLGIPPFLGPPLGTTWYDSLQVKGTKRYSHGLSVDVAFTWQKELTQGVNSDTSYLTPNPPLINDVFNYRQNKQISGFSRPLMMVVSFNYTTPGFNADNAGFKALSWAVRDWTVGGALRYQSGSVLRVPASNNGLFTQLKRTDNPAIWGGATTYYNRNAGQDLMLVDPNCHCFDPTTTRVFNAAAWTDAAAGQYGTSAPYYNEYRWQRQPAESLAIGRDFRLAKERRVTLNVRVEFQNIFNRLFLGSPTGANVMNPASPVSPNGFGGFNGFGYINTVNGAGSSPRAGQMIARLRF